MANGLPLVWRMSIRDEVNRLVVPHGFTLSVGGVLAISVGHQEIATPWEVWLFLVGAVGGFSTSILVSAAHRSDVRPAPPLAGAALFNLVPLVVVPLAVSASWWVASHALAALLAGFVTSFGYLALLAAVLTVLTAQRRRRPGPWTTGT